MSEDHGLERHELKAPEGRRYVDDTNQDYVVVPQSGRTA